MTLDFNLVALLDLLAFVQGTLLGVLLMFKWKKHFSFFLLGLFLFTYSSELINSVLFDTNIYSQKPAFLYPPVTFYFWFMPALYLYVRSLSSSINWKRMIWLFLPGIIEFIVILFLFIQPAATKLQQFNNGWAFHFYSNYVDIAMVYSILYAIIILRFIKQHQISVQNYYSNSHGKLLNWVKWICLFIVFINLGLLSGSFIDIRAYQQLLYPVVSGLNVILIFWIALSGFRQKVIALPESKEKRANNIVPLKEVSSDDIKSKEFERVLNYLTEEKVFIQPELHLADLAQQLNFSQRHLSELINQNAGVNFNQFINQFRVSEAKKLLVDKKYAHLNILGIGYEVGFNSKTSFYAAFKRETGIAPSKFQKQARASS